MTNTIPMAEQTTTFKIPRASSRPWEGLIEAALFLSSLVAVLTTFGILGVLIVESLPFFSQVPLTAFLFDTEWTPLFVDKRFGIWPLVSGTVLTSFIAVLFAVPAGVTIAVYLSEFAAKPVRSVLKPLLELLAGLPTILYGYFAFSFVTPLLKTFIPDLGAFNALSAGLVMGLMILPMVASLSEDALYVVPRSMREGAYALGASKLQMIVGSILPAAVGGITAAFILAVSRAIGETMIVAIAAGQQPLLHFNPFQPVETMTAYIVQVSQGDTPHGTLEYHTLFAVALVLFVFTMGLNIVSITIRNRYKRMFR